jgi:hypothetical protein
MTLDLSLFDMKPPHVECQMVADITSLEKALGQELPEFPEDFPYNNYTTGKGRRKKQASNRDTPSSSSSYPQKRYAPPSASVMELRRTLFSTPEPPPMSTVMELRKELFSSTTHSETNTTKVSVLAQEVALITIDDDDVDNDD